ncbi:CLUMA_CG014952, isoform A, partial [Clunio marinus]
MFGSNPNFLLKNKAKVKRSKKMLHKINGTAFGICEIKFTFDFVIDSSTISPGFPGQKGIKGDLGPEGPPGKSIRGGQGRPGPKGTRGEHGQRGLDGRDGVPGEPGLDGVPGRAGTDGKDGTNGIDGRKGERGKDGKDGIPGNVGPSGPRGPKGEKGLAGPQGRKGPSGKDGLNGTPGTCLYCMKRNESSPYDYWLPPQIPISSSNSKKIRPIIIREEDNLRIQCAATGYPKPTIVWEREDGRPIDWGKWKDNSKVGQSINITKINRVHMGTYICIADNAIPPVAEYKFKVEVHFKPTLRIRHKWDQAIQADFGAKITFKCESEGFPEPVLYWERADGVVIPNDSIKYRIESHTLDSYIFNTSLTINNVNQYDYGEYYCVGKNLHGIEKILFRLGTRGQWTRPFPGDGDKPVVSGETPPVLSYEDVCPPPEACPFCPTPKDLKCKDTSLSLKDLTGGKELEILPIENATYPELENRTQDCEVSVIGKPVFHNHLDMDHGAWLRDAIQQDNVTIEKIWLTKDTETNNLYEFKNRIDYRKNVPSRNQPYKLLCPFKGNAHIVYNANFYYFCADGPKIIRYDLKTERVAATRILDNINATQYLYTTQYNVIDFNADDNGLWIIHATPDSNYTIVSKINETTLETTNSFNISIHHHKVGEMFIVCGVLYAVDSATVRYTKIRFALDLYSKKLLDKELNFVNPFNSTTTIGYNHNKNELYTWNLGNQFTY